MTLSYHCQKLVEFLRPEPALAQKEGPLFSIVIPSFHCAEKLERSIASVLRQPREF